LADARAHFAAARGQNPAGGDAQRAAVLATAQINTLNGLLEQLGRDLTRETEDVTTQQTCAAQNRRLLADLYNGNGGQRLTGGSSTSIPRGR
jgi:hypothetical protein